MEDDKKTAQKERNASEEEKNKTANREDVRDGSGSAENSSAPNERERREAAMKSILTGEAFKRRIGR